VRGDCLGGVIVLDQKCLLEQTAAENFVSGYRHIRLLFFDF